jgi:hypothetical protein
MIAPRAILGSVLLLLVSAQNSFAETGETCLASDNSAQATCLTMITTVRELMGGDTHTDPACAAGSNDPRITEDVIAWIRDHPERKGDDLGLLIHDAVIAVDPCARGPLIPTPSESDDIDTE